MPFVECVICGIQLFVASPMPKKWVCDTCQKKELEIDLGETKLEPESKTSFSQNTK